MFENYEDDHRPLNFIVKKILEIKSTLYRIYVISRSYEKIMNVLPVE